MDQRRTAGHIKSNLNQRVALRSATVLSADRRQGGGSPAPTSREKLPAGPTIAGWSAWGLFEGGTGNPISGRFEVALGKEVPLID